MEEKILDMRSDEAHAMGPEMRRCAVLCHRINEAEPYSERMRELESELFEGKLPENSMFVPPLSIDLASNVTVGERVYVNNNFIAMARGGIIIEDGVMIAPRVSVLTANHDLTDHEILKCRPRSAAQKRVDRRGGNHTAGRDRGRGRRSRRGRGGNKGRAALYRGRRQPGKNHKRNQKGELKQC